MKARTPIRARPGLPARAWLGPLLLAISASLALLLPSTSAAGTPPLTPAAYGVSSLCSTPAPGYAGCLGLRLVAKEPLSQPGAQALPEHESAQAPEGPETAGEAGGEESPEAGDTPATEFKKPNKNALTPGNLLSAYNLTGVTPSSAQTIGIVDAFDDATVQSDLETFSSQFGLPACNESAATNTCFRKLNQEGRASPLPASSGELERGWAQEIATDVEVSHGLCPSCKIVLVEARTNSDGDLFAAEQTAAGLGVNEISNSWGGGEPSSDSPAFNHPGIVITASAGDDGYLNWDSNTAPESAEYPASSPHVVAVGGTRLLLSSSKTWENETVWNDGGERAGVKEGAGADGGGCSSLFTAAPWQQSVPDWSSVGCGTRRAVSDVAADADPYTGVAVYDSTEDPEGDKGWGVIGGTSVASPIIASVFALAGGAQGFSYPARLLYENELNNAGSLHDVTTGSNGECLKPFAKNSGTSGCSTLEEAESCSELTICLATSGYDGPTGVGTPNGIGAFQPTSGSSVHEVPATGGGSSGAPQTSPANVAPSTPAGPTTGPAAPAPAPAPATAAAPLLSALSLTHSAIAALAHTRARLSSVGFAFTLSSAASVRVTISRRVRVHGRLQWKAISKSITIAASSGRQSRHLSGRSALATGRYQLTLAPVRGLSRSIVFRIG